MYCDMCGKEVHERPQDRDPNNTLLLYGRVKLILRPLYPNVYTDSEETSSDLCEECRGVIDEFIKCLRSTIQGVEKKHLTVKEFLKEMHKGKKSNNLVALELMGKFGNINIMVLKLYNFLKLKTGLRVIIHARQKP